MAGLGGYIYTSCFVQLFLPATPYGASLRRADHGLGHHLARVRVQDEIRHSRTPRVHILARCLEFRPRISIYLRLHPDEIEI